MRITCFALTLLFLAGCRDAQSIEHAHLSHDTLSKETEKAPRDVLNPNQKLSVLGFYSNEESFDGEHASGYFLHLWHQRDHLAGRIARDVGAIGDQETGTFIRGSLENGNKISFNSRLGEDPIQFSGYLQSSGIEATIHFGSGKTEEIFLEKCCVDAPIHQSYANLDEWNAMWKSFDQ